MTMPAPAPTNPLIEAKRALHAAGQTINDVQAAGDQLGLDVVIAYAHAQATLALADATWAALQAARGGPPGGGLLVPGR